MTASILKGRPRGWWSPDGETCKGVSPDMRPYLPFGHLPATISPDVRREARYLFDLWWPPPARLQPCDPAIEAPSK